LKVITEAIGVLQNTTSGAVGQAYSFVQVAATSTMHTHTDLAKSEVLALIKKLATQHHSVALSQLASRIAAVARYASANGEDPFAKVKGLIQDLIAKLKAEAGAEATEKAFCDEHMTKAITTRDQMNAQLESSRMDKTKNEVAQLEAQCGVVCGRRLAHLAYAGAKGAYLLARVW